MEMSAALKLREQEKKKKKAHLYSLLYFVKVCASGLPTGLEKCLQLHLWPVGHA